MKTDIREMACEHGKLIEVAVSTAKKAWGP